MLGSVDEVLDTASQRVDARSGIGLRREKIGMRRERVRGGGERKRGEGEVDGGEVGGDGETGLLHEENGVGGVDEVAVASADEAAEIVLLLLDEGAGAGFGSSDVGDWFRAEQRFGVSVTAAAEAGPLEALLRRKYSHCSTLLLRVLSV